MKYFISIALVLFAMAFTTRQSVVTASNEVTSRKESAIVRIDQMVKLKDVFLKGEYMFVHDDEAMAAGEDCTRVYKMSGGQPGELVCSFHCIPVNRAKAKSFTMRSSLILTGSNLREVTEIQFAGSTEGHQVPSRDEARR
jgi:hypothetical protein